MMNFTTIEEFGSAVRSVRKARKMTQKELSKKARVPQSTISEIENGDTEVSVLKALRILASLDIKIKFSVRKR